MAQISCFSFFGEASGEITWRARKNGGNSIVPQKRSVALDLDELTVYDVLKRLLDVLFFKVFRTHHTRTVEGSVRTLDVPGPCLQALGVFRGTEQRHFLFARLVTAVTVRHKARFGPFRRHCTPIYSLKETNKPAPLLAFVEARPHRKATSGTVSQHGVAGGGGGGGNRTPGSSAP